MNHPYLSGALADAHRAALMSTAAHRHPARRGRNRASGWLARTAQATVRALRTAPTPSPRPAITGA